jgi:Hypervirulence associated proteins TUDOR domain
MSTEFHKGDKVCWESSQGTIEGTVERKLTEPMEIDRHHVAASPDNPQYLVKSDKTGRMAAHRPTSLQRRED